MFKKKIRIKLFVIFDLKPTKKKKKTVFVINSLYVELSIYLAVFKFFYILLKK